jgi:hypothetical protein
MAFESPNCGPPGISNVPAQCASLAGRVCACKRKPFRRRAACCPKPLLHLRALRAEPPQGSQQLRFSRQLAKFNTLANGRMHQNATTLEPFASCIEDVPHYQNIYLRKCFRVYCCMDTSSPLLSGTRLLWSMFSIVFSSLPNGIRLSQLCNHAQFRSPFIHHYLGFRRRSMHPHFFRTTT